MGVACPATHAPFWLTSGIQYHVADSPPRERRARTPVPPRRKGAANGAESSSVIVSAERGDAAPTGCHAQLSFLPIGSAVAFVATAASTSALSTFGLNASSARACNDRRVTTGPDLRNRSTVEAIPSSCSRMHIDSSTPDGTAVNCGTVGAGAAVFDAAGRRTRTG